MRRVTTWQGLLAVMLACCGALNLTVAFWALGAHPRLNTDFLAFWSFPRFAATHPIAEIYRAGSLRIFQQTLYPGFHSFYPYLYPPTFLLATWWLRWLNFYGAQLLWTLAGATLLAAAGWALFRRWAVVLAMLASPAALLNFATGETAGFTTGLLLLGCAWLPHRKALAGIAFGLLTLKPQLALLLPVALLGGGEYLALAVAAAVALALVAASCLAFPRGLWLVWARSLPHYQTQYFNGAGLNLNILVTPAANSVASGGREITAWSVQAGCAVFVVAAVFLCFRHGRRRLAMAALLCGGFLATPHAYAYDTICLTAALALCLESLARPPAALLALGGAIYLGPLLLLSPAHGWFFYAPPEMLLFIAIIALALADSNRAIMADEPELPYHHAG